ncbi:MAG: hypothetical protein B6D64_11525 [Bacteroidetes bacterium 4484_276]|nr:MAG: hypothetical protein B6D64_11525 [Bacteroidetes bacterium 4484_276]
MFLMTFFYSQHIRIIFSQCVTIHQGGIKIFFIFTGLFLCQNSKHQKPTTMLLKTTLFNIALLFCLTNSTYPQEYVHAEVYGGKQQLREFIKEELVYPEKALNENTEGTVILSFIVKSDGAIENLKVSQSVSPELDNEAMRIFNQLLWDPANYRGMQLDEEQSMEFPFKLKKYKRCAKHRGYSEINYPYTLVDQSLTIYKGHQLDERAKPIFKEKGMGFNQFIAKNLVYPEAAMKQNIRGTVEVFFVVEPSGRVSNVKVLKPVGAGCSQEAIRLIKMLKWMPGIKDGKAVRTKLILKISFNLADFEQHRYISPNNANQM